MLHVAVSGEKLSRSPFHDVGWFDRTYTEHSKEIITEQSIVADVCFAIFIVFFPLWKRLFWNEPWLCAFPNRNPGIPIFSYGNGLFSEFGRVGNEDDENKECKRTGFSNIKECFPFQFFRQAFPWLFLLIFLPLAKFVFRYRCSKQCFPTVILEFSHSV